MPTYNLKWVAWGSPVRKIVLAALYILLCLSLISIFPFEASAGSVKDIEGHWAAADIEKAISMGYVKGYPDGRFRPDAGVTRAEFVAMVDSAFQVAPGQGEQTFKDVGARDWFAPSVKAALASGFVSGYPDGTFRPQQAVSRQEAACLLAKLLKLDGGDQPSVSDVNQIAAWARPFVSTLLAKGIVSGYPDGAFRPQKSISRAEAVVMIAKAIAAQTGTPVSGQPLPQPNPPTGSRGDMSALDIQVKQGSTGTTVDISGAYGGACQWTEEANPQRLVVTVPGVTAVRNPMEIDVGTGGLDKIVTSFPGATLGTAEVEIYFAATSAPLVYQTAAGTNGELAITVPPQIYRIQAGQVSDFVAVNITGTAPLSFNASSLPGPPAQLVFDFNGFTLNSSLQSWQQQLDALGVGDIQLGQYQPGVVRLTVAAGSDISYTSDSSSDGQQFVLRLQKAADNPPVVPTKGATPNGGPYYGMDVWQYPGDAAMQAWRNDSPFYYTGFYLAPAPNHPDASWMNKRQVLVNQGWGLMPVYVGRQAGSPNLNAATGIGDADDAVNLARSAGFPDHTTIFLDIETSVPLTARYLNYVISWAKEIRGKSAYSVGIYCNANNASQIRNALACPAEFWVAHYKGHDLAQPAPTPASSGVSFAGAWQFAGDSALAYGGYSITVDLNTSTSPDPSMQ